MARIRTIRTETIVLRHHIFGEADRILTLLTPDKGKLRAIAKGVRKPASRKTGHLDLFMRSDVLLTIGRNLYVITQAQTIDAYRELREDLIRSTYASCCVELLDRFTPDEEANEVLYKLLAEMLSYVSFSDNLSLLLRYYELKLLDTVGFRPELEFCLNNKEPIKAEDQYFDAIAGGVLCPKCGVNKKNSRKISVDALKIMRFLQRSDFEKVKNLYLRPKIATELENIHLNYLTVQLERQLKSVSFLEKVRLMGNN